MKNTIILFLVACIAIATAEVVCPVLSCKDNTDTCGLTNMVKHQLYEGCQELDNVCYITEQGSNFNRGTCVRLPGNNEACLSSTGIFSTQQCANGYQCVTGTCIASTSTPAKVEVNAGYPCGAHTECYFPTAPSGEGTCNSGVCQFTPDVQACTFDTECNQATGSDCIAGTCTAKVGERGVCNVNNSLSVARCADYMTCVPTTSSNTAGTCEYYYSQKSGHACDADYHCSNGFCRPKAVGQVYGTCQGYKKTSTRDKPCIDSSYCTRDNGEVCSCDGGEEAKCKVVDKDKDSILQQIKKDQCDAKADAQCGPKAYDTLECRFNVCGKKTYCEYYKGLRLSGEIQDELEDYEFCFAAEKCDAASLLASLPILVAVAVIALFFQ